MKLYFIGAAVGIVVGAAGTFMWLFLLSLEEYGRNGRAWRPGRTSWFVLGSIVAIEIALDILLRSL